jgi:glycosyltransferase involved in cell wall biosynthesis
MQIVTLATRRGLPRARVLARSLARHQPTWAHEVLMVADEQTASQVAAGEQHMNLRSVCSELELDVEALTALHREQDLTSLLVPGLLRRYAERGPVVHLPSSAWVLASLEPIEAALDNAAVMLVPRFSGELPRDGLEPSQGELERVGRVEETIMGIDSSPEALAFLSWWDELVQQYLGSLDARRSGARPEDRQWLARFLELAPARFAAAVLEDSGCNLNLWNLHAHTLTRSGQGVLVDGQAPLRFMDLPGFEPDRPHQLSSTASRARVSRSPALHALSESYAAELRACGWHDSDHHADVGRRLDGLVYDESLRALYASALELGACSEDLFSEEGTREFIAWLEGPAPKGAALGINRYVFYRVARERPDVVRAYQDLDGEDGPGYLGWCCAFGREELGIPERFMPSRHASVVPVAAPAVGEPAGTGPVATSAQEEDSNGAQQGPAVRLTGYLGHTLGLGAAARGYVQALGAVGVPVRTVSVPLHHLALPVELEAEYGRHGFEEVVHEGRHGVEIVAVNADELPGLVERLGEDYFDGPRIGIWGWETNSIPSRWQRAFALVEEIWVYSRFMAENIGAVAPIPVLALPPPVSEPAPSSAPLRLGVRDGFLFLFVFDYLSTVQRKNPVGLIEAFRRAFEPGEGPQLLIKTINAPLRPLAEEELLWAAHGRDDIHVVDRSLSGAELGALMRSCDCYVSLHRAEGFGLTMAEAMAAGKPVIATGYSGNVDFMNAANSYLVDYEIGRVGPDCEIYPPEGEWAQPSVGHAAKLMRHVHEHPGEAAQVGERARQDVLRNLSPEATGAAMRRRLEELTSAEAERARFDATPSGQ